MATIRYSVITYRCPCCGMVIKEYSTLPLWYVILMFGTVFMASSWLITTAILRAIFKSSEIKKLGSPYIVCKHCKKPILSGEKQEWTSFTAEQKKIWTFRWLFRSSYALGGLIPLLIIIPLLFGAWQSNHESDRSIAIILLIAAITIFAIICVIGCFWYKYKNFQQIVMTKRDYSLVLLSKARTNDNRPEILPVKILGK